MPCFKGLAVSIHTPDGPLPEFSIQRQSRHSRITSYIPVPPPKVPTASASNKPEQSTFAISITLLTPGQTVPYSLPTPSIADPFPRPRIVGSLPTFTEERGKLSGVIGPYIPLTSSGNETVAAYIYFDGRVKEEVATLLRRGEETWVNSRWVSVPESEGGGLAEREFLFREVGLERWLNGLDLEGKDIAAKIERRKQRMEKRRRRRKEVKVEGSEQSDMDMDGKDAKDAATKEDVLRYGSDKLSPVEKLSDDDDVLLSSDSESEDDPVPEAAGQIKVALFRVLASGEIKRGEYSPQFDAHDDDEDSEPGRPSKGAAANGEGGGDDADIDHTTSFAKPKSLDPKSISTQTVTGIDGPEKPYAVFTFLYRGERQLQKMGILPNSQAPEKSAATPGKRRSIQTDFSKLGPLKAGGTVGFSAFRDNDVTSPGLGSKGTGKKGVSKDADSDEDDDVDVDREERVGDVDAKEDDKVEVSAEQTEGQGELAEGLRKIKLKRVHSADPLSDAPRKSPPSNTPTAGRSPEKEPDLGLSPPPIQSNNISTSRFQGQDETVIGSPLKKARPSLPGPEDESIRSRFQLGSAAVLGDVLGTSPKPIEEPSKKAGDDGDEEL
ncbi:MAG: hypothetical protein M1833_004910 [Piccolia ochrophora]|nr:MAG: hypothetical protein M1833_004910 [Piccolia ochrophora]